MVSSVNVVQLGKTTIFISLLQKNRIDEILFFFNKTSVRLNEFLEFFERLGFAIVNSSKNVKIT